LKVNDENSRIRIQDLDPNPDPLVRGISADPDPDPPQNVMDPQHCLRLMDPNPDPGGQSCGSGSGLDPDSIGSVDPDSIRSVDPDSESGSGSRRAKMTHKSRKKFVKVHVLKCWMASFES
jgi:hypothetical protein